VSQKQSNCTVKYGPADADIVPYRSAVADSAQTDTMYRNYGSAHYPVMLVQLEDLGGDSAGESGLDAPVDYLRDGSEDLGCTGPAIVAFRGQNLCHRPTEQKWPGQQNMIYTGYLGRQQGSEAPVDHLCDGSEAPGNLLRDGSGDFGCTGPESLVERK
jgi:hypothetical protein